MAEIEIGLGKSGRRAYGFDDIAIVPSRRTRDPEDVDITWEIDAYRFDMPLMASAMDGVVNGVAPEPVSMASLASALGSCLGRPSLLPVPGPVLHLLLGDGARVVLDGQQVRSERLSQFGFRFRYPHLPEALAAATTR